MGRVYAAELRDSWSAWLGVSLTFIAVNASLALAVLTAYSGLRSEPALRGDLGTLTYWWVAGISTVFLILMVAVPVIGSATALVVGSRRGSLARLALAGASPQQVRRAIIVQLVAVTLACAVVGDLLGIAALGPWSALNDIQARAEAWYVPLVPVVAFAPLAGTNLFCALVAVAAGARQARVASEIPPVEALRQAQVPAAPTRLRLGAWAGIVACLLLVLLSIGSVLLQIELGNRDVISNVVMASSLQVFVWAVLWALASPMLVRPLTRAWTASIPSREPVWVLARATISARADRLSKSVVPVMFAFAVGVGGLGIFDSAKASAAAAAVRDELMMPGLDSFVTLFGLPLLVAFLGGVGSLIMMSRQRDAELALTGIAGATPAQRVSITLMEALILTGTSAILAAFVIVPSYVFQAWAFTAIGETWVPVFSFTSAMAALVGGFVLNAATTVLPTLPALRLPEQRVIARLVAE